MRLECVTAECERFNDKRCRVSWGDAESFQMPAVMC